MDNGFLEKKKKPWSVAFASFCGVNTSAMTDYNLPISHYWVQTWEEAHTNWASWGGMIGSNTSLSSTLVASGRSELTLSKPWSFLFVYILLICFLSGWIDPPTQEKFESS